MREVFAMWRSTKMVVLVALTAAIYAAILIPFKGIPIVPGFTEVRPAVVVPVAFGLLFGPAGAWGSGLGNVIGDLFGGTLSLGSIFGFFGNFFFALTMYKAWGRTEPKAESLRSVVRFVLVTVLASAVCALMVAWGVDLLGILPFAALGSIIFANNAIGGAILGPVLFRLIQPRVAAWHLLWTEILDPSEVSPGYSPRLGALLLWLGGLGGLAVGITLSSGLGHGRLSQLGAAWAGVGATVGTLPFLVAFLVGCLLA